MQYDQITILPRITYHRGSNPRLGGHASPEETYLTWFAAIIDHSVIFLVANKNKNIPFMAGLRNMYV